MHPKGCQAAPFVKLLAKVLLIGPDSSCVEHLLPDDSTDVDEMVPARPRLSTGMAHECRTMDFALQCTWHSFFHHHGSPAHATIARGFRSKHSWLAFKPLPGITPHC